MGVVETDPALEPPGEVGGQLALEQIAVESVADLRRGAIGVAEVGEEESLLGADEAEAAGAGEATGPEDVRLRLAARVRGGDEVADDQQVELGLGDGLGEALGVALRGAHLRLTA